LSRRELFGGVIIKMRRLDMFSKCCECLALALTLTACQISAEDPNETATELAVRDGRLRFPDMQTFVDTVTGLNTLSEDQLTPDYFSSRLANFTSLAMLAPAARPNIPSMAATMMVILDPDGTYEVDGTIFMIHADAEYVIPYSERSLVGRLVAGEPAQRYVESGQIEYHPISRQFSHGSSKDPVGGVSSLLDAKYQLEFGASGVTFKFVDEAYVDTYSNYLMACFRSKLEYLHKRTIGRDTWEAAGERVYKEITSATIAYEITPRSRTASVGPFSSIRNDSDNLEVCVQIMPLVGTCAGKPKLTAEYYSEGTDSNIVGHILEQSAAWLTEFDSLAACN
jgi:hypothetical protein